MSSTMWSVSSSSACSGSRGGDDLDLEWSEALDLGLVLAVDGAALLCFSVTSLN
jgi:hypothetical protein